MAKKNDVQKSCKLISQNYKQNMYKKFYQFSNEEKQTLKFSV